ncbi:hypothetical protein Q3A66_01240 [Hymenobacter sp. BT770]|uniref:hypothetical protein n=1 Tax=Hymenobacter sp. BT770 TaxID=2886942 RepID=UPI001D11CC24|nr:hypothetical protein [Hymenobacter sp. BT770]MCC3153712.1 hypothetical protein [Hymenobacter sp. BT770]MDO3413675.1 hypothetical protein [Hymenobacter sp. BT770]
MKKHFHPLGDWRRNVLLMAAASSLGLTVPACSSDNNRADENGAEASWGGQSYSEGVITEMTEVQPGEWKITAERPAGKEEVAAIMHHFDGKTDTLQGQALQRQMQDYSRANPENRAQGNGMMDVLMWSGIGYMAGRFLTPNPGYYANPGLLQRNQAWRANVARERQNQGRGFFGRGFAGGRTSPNAGIQESRSTLRSSPRPSFRSSAPSGRSSRFGSRGGFRGFGG